MKAITGEVYDEAHKCRIQNKLDVHSIADVGDRCCHIVAIEHGTLWHTSESSFTFTVVVLDGIDSMLLGHRRYYPSQL